MKVGDRVQINNGKRAHIVIFISELDDRWIITFCGLTPTFRHYKFAPADLPLCKKCQRSYDKEQGK